VTEKAGGAKRHTPLLDSLQRFLKRMRDEPEHAADFAQKIAADLTDFLSNHNGQVIVCHVQGGKLPHFVMRKRTKLTPSAWMKAFDIAWLSPLHSVL
jgi:DNA gyrase inhibitor GyrI